MQVFAGLCTGVLVKSQVRDRSLITSRGGGGQWFWRGDTILKQSPFWGVNFSPVRNMRGFKFYDTATAV